MVLDERHGGLEPGLLQRRLKEQQAGGKVAPALVYRRLQAQHHAAGIGRQPSGFTDSFQHTKRTIKVETEVHVCSQRHSLCDLLPCSLAGIMGNASDIALKTALFHASDLSILVPLLLVALTVLKVAGGRALRTLQGLEGLASNCHGRFKGLEFREHVGRGGEVLVRDGRLRAHAPLNGAAFYSNRELFQQARSWRAWLFCCLRAVALNNAIMMLVVEVVAVAFFVNISAGGRRMAKTGQRALDGGELCLGLQTRRRGRQGDGICFSAWVSRRGRKPPTFGGVVHRHTDGQHGTHDSSHADHSSHKHSGIPNVSRQGATDAVLQQPTPPFSSPFSSCFRCCHPFLFGPGHAFAMCGPIFFGSTCLRISCFQQKPTNPSNSNSSQGASIMPRAVSTDSAAGAAKQLSKKQKLKSQQQQQQQQQQNKKTKKTKNEVEKKSVDAEATKQNGGKARAKQSSKAASKKGVSAPDESEIELKRAKTATANNKAEKKSKSKAEKVDAQGAEEKSQEEEQPKAGASAIAVHMGNPAANGSDDTANQRKSKKKRNSKKKPTKVCHSALNAFMIGLF